MSSGHPHGTEGGSDRWPRLVGVILAAAVLSGCAADPAPRKEPGTAGHSQLRIGLTEWSIETAGSVASAGDVTLLVTNAGGTGHDLVVEGEQGTWATPVLAPGESASLLVEATGGEVLRLLCTVTGHDAQGMRAALVVAADA